MKKLTAIAALSVLTVVSAPSFANPVSDVLSVFKAKGIYNDSENRNATNTAIGKNSKANLGSIYLGSSAGGKVGIDVVVLRSKNDGASNTAVGDESEANLGSIYIPKN